MRRVSGWALVAASLVLASAAAQQGGGDVDATLARVGDHVQQYYARARSLVCQETVRLQPLGSSLSPDGFGRELVYELRVEWEASADGDASPEASVVRQLRTINGRPPRPKDTPGCMDPKPVSPEPLAMLLPARRGDFAFAWKGTGKTDGRASVMLDYRSVAAKPAEIVWHDECVSVDLPGRTRGRVWVDAATSEVLRLDEELIGMFEFRVPKEHRRYGNPDSMVIERADSSIRYKPVAFHDPEETVMLPASIDSLTIFRNTGVPRLRTTQTFSGYKRFMTAGRIVKEPDRH